MAISDLFTSRKFREEVALRNEREKQVAQQSLSNMANGVLDDWVKRLHVIKQGNIDILTAIDRISNDVASVGIHRYSTEKETNAQTITNDGIETMLSQFPNAYENKTPFFARIVRKMMITGEAWVYVKSGRGGNEMFEVKTITSQDSSTDKYQITYYTGDNPNGQGHRWFTADPIEVDYKDLLHFDNPRAIITPYLEDYAHAIDQSIEDMQNTLENNFGFRGFFELSPDFDMKRESNILENIIKGALSSSKQFSGLAPLPKGVNFKQVTDNYEAIDNDKIKFLSDKILSGLGLTPTIISGDADKDVILAYMNSTVLPIVKTLVEEMNKKLFTQTKRNYGNFIGYEEMPFIASRSDLLTNAINAYNGSLISRNEAREVWQMPPLASDLFRETTMTQSLTDHNGNETDASAQDNSATQTETSVL